MAFDIFRGWHRGPFNRINRLGCRISPLQKHICGRPQRVSLQFHASLRQRRGDVHAVFCGGPVVLCFVECVARGGLDSV
jgi:hypothetical protein